MINQNSPHGYKSNQSAWLWIVLFVIAVVLFITFMLSTTPAYAMACAACDEAGTRPNVASVQAGKDNDTESNTLTVNVPNDTHIIIDDPAIPDNNTDTSTDEQVNTGTDDNNEDNHPDVHNNNGHGNNEDGVDSSNPGNGPKNEDGNDPSAPIDDESTHNNGHNH